eukprot:15267-Heterococcus_DN1.PRE.2
MAILAVAVRLPSAVQHKLYSRAGAVLCCALLLVTHTRAHCDSSAALSCVASGAAHHTVCSHELMHSFWASAHIVLQTGFCTA